MEIKPTHNKIIEKFIDDNFFIISELIISKDELLSILKESLKNALSTKSMKMSEKNSSFMIEYLQDNGLPIEYFPSSLDSDDLM